MNEKTIEKALEILNEQAKKSWEAPKEQEKEYRAFVNGMRGMLALIVSDNHTNGKSIEFDPLYVGYYIKG